MGVRILERYKMFERIKEQAELTVRECQIITDRLEGKTYKQLSEIHSISKARTQQLVKRIVRKIEKAVILANSRAKYITKEETTALQSKPFFEWTQKEIYENFDKIPNRIDRILKLDNNKTRICNCLFRHGIYTIEQIKDDDFFWQDIANFYNMGITSMNILKNKYNEYKNNQLLSEKKGNN